MSCPTVELLAECPCAKVTRCDGGHLHLTVGPVTVCMDPQVFEAVVFTLRDAQQRMKSASELRQ
jgi:hypothetical protein